jgi:molecular chaperone DnaK (HSP70)
MDIVFTKEEYNTILFCVLYTLNHLKQDSDKEFDRVLKKLRILLENNEVKEDIERYLSKADKSEKEIMQRKIEKLKFDIIDKLKNQ